MLKVGGCSYNNRIKFFAEKYSATFRYQNGKSHIFLRKVTSKEYGFWDCNSYTCHIHFYSFFYVTFGVFTFLMLKLITTIFNIKILTSIFFTIVWAIAYELFLLDYSKPLINWLIKISYWLQKNIFTREPTDLQLRLAIETFQLLEKAEKGLIPKNELAELLNNGKKSTLPN